MTEADDAATGRDLLEAFAENIEEEACDPEEEILVTSTLSADESCDFPDVDDAEIDKVDSEADCADVPACGGVPSDDEQPVNAVMSSKQAMITRRTRFNFPQC